MHASPLLLALVACGPRQEPTAAADEPRLDDRRAERSQIMPYATFTDRRPTGVAVSRDGRVFVNFPYWEDPHDLSVARVLPGGKVSAYPDAEWNAWDGDPATVDRHFVCVQSLWADGRGGLWILDAGAPGMGEVIEGAPKLVHVDLLTDRVDATYWFDEATVANSYLNDVRVDPNRRMAYLTDSGSGALVVLDLETRKARRVLGSHPSTSAEDLTLVVNDHPMLDDRRGDRPFRAHADGIALDRDGRYLYWHPLVGRNLYRIDTRVLSDDTRTPADLRDAVEIVARTVASDGLEVDDQGRILHTAIELDAIVAFDPASGKLEKIAQHELLSWPDSIAVAGDGRLYVTTSRIHEMARYNDGVDRQAGPTGLYVIPPPDEVTLRAWSP